jgi:4,5-dihydroxyphthalate decarboxylase
MRKPRITLSCRPYLHVHPLIDGTIVPDGADLNVIPLEVEEIFWRQLKHEEFDVSEMSLSSYVMARSRGDERFVAIPVFPLRAFRHSCIYINAQKGIKEPADLHGKKVGVPEYQMTACLWLRGLLQHEYGVHPREIEWRGGGQENPGREEKLKLQLPPDIRYEPIPNDKTLSQMLDSGEIDALLTARTPSCFAKGSPNVTRLFDNFIEMEGKYYIKTGIFPIMHTIALKRRVYEENPWLAMSLYKAFRDARDIIVKGLLQSGGAPLYSILPWGAWEAARTRSVMGEDWWPYGIEKNRNTVEALCQYSCEQGLSSRLMSMEELFAAETFDEFKI